MDFKVTNSFSRENLNYEVGTVKNIHYGDIHTKFQTLFDITNETVPYINEELNIEKIAEQNYCEEGDIIFADASEDLLDVGKSIEIVNLNKEKLLSGLHTLLARPEKGIFCLGFNGHLFKSNFVRTQIQKEAQGTKVLSINTGRISKIDLSYPDIKEQAKITLLLSLIDERIQTQNKIIEELTLLKNTISRKILSRHLKFKDESGNEFPMWELKKLREVLLKNSKKNKLLRYSTVQSVSNKFGFINQEDFFEDRRVASIDTSNYYVIKKGTFAYNPSRIDVGSLAYKADDNVSIISPLYISFQANSNYLIDNFLLNWFFGIEFIHQMHNSFEGSVRNTLSYESLEKINISIPSIAEQAKISDYLLSFTNKIEIENTLLRSLQREKKYFLLNLFI